MDKPQTTLTQQEIVYLAALKSHPGWTIALSWLHKNHDDLLDEIELAQNKDEETRKVSLWRSIRWVFRKLDEITDISGAGSTETTLTDPQSYDAPKLIRSMTEEEIRSALSDMHRATNPYSLEAEKALYDNFEAGEDS